LSENLIEGSVLAADGRLDHRRALAGEIAATTVAARETLAEPTEGVLARDAAS
jgi:hypothetical protein